LTHFREAETAFLNLALQHLESNSDGL